MKKKLIAHRGNISGPNVKKENHPDYILTTLASGYDVEIDVWLIDGTFLLGHDDPQYQVDSWFLLQDGIWCHAKNIEALDAMLKIGAHCFWHDHDAVTLTSRGFIWSYPGSDLVSKSVCVLPETVNSKQDYSSCYAVCSDFVEVIKSD